MAGESIYHYTNPTGNTVAIRATTSGVVITSRLAIMPDDEIPALIKALKGYLASKPTRVVNDYGSDGKLIGCHEEPI